MCLFRCCFFCFAFSIFFKVLQLRGKPEKADRMPDRKARELRRAYRFLGVDEAWQANASVLTKSVSRPLAEVVANYGEVRAALLRTKWAGEVG